MPIEFRFDIVDQFPEPAFTELAREAFADYEPSALLTSVLDDEAAARSGNRTPVHEGALRIAAFRGKTLVGWTYARPDGQHLHMVNSGVGGWLPGRVTVGLVPQTTVLLFMHCATRNSSDGWCQVFQKSACTE